MQSSPLPLRLLPIGQVVTLAILVLGVAGFIAAGEEMSGAKWFGLSPFDQVYKGFVALCGGSIGTVALIIAYRYQRVRQAEGHLEALQHTEDPLAARITRLQEHLQETARLLPTLQAELELRNATLAALKESAEHYESLAALHQNEAAAVQRLVKETVAQGVSEVEDGGRRQQWLFFISGSAFSIPLGVTGNYVYEILTK